MTRSPEPAPGTDRHTGPDAAPGASPPPDASRATAPTGLTRRGVLRALAIAGAGAGLGAAGGLAGAGALGRTDPPSGTTPGPSTRPEPVAPHGPHQAGIARPRTPQRHGYVLVVDLPDLPTSPRSVREVCARAGAAVTAVTEHGATAGLPDGPRDLTVTVGLGPRLVAAVDAALPGAEELPDFAGDEAIPAAHRGGDLLVAAYSSDPNDAELAAQWLADELPGSRPRWSQRGFRAPGTGTVTRSPIGFHDGVIVPRTPAELAEHVWIPDGPLAGGTVCVIRRLRLDTARFRAEPLDRQEAVIGRRRDDGSPLSGGGPEAEVDVLAKAPTGELLTPPRSHARAAHPSFTDSRLMLRRGYAYDNGTADGVRDAGLLFVCFQQDLRTFVATQHRLDETDDLMGYVTPTASATFLVLPGFTPGAPMGATLPT